MKIQIGIVCSLLAILFGGRDIASADDSSDAVWWLNKAVEYADLVQPDEDRTEAHYKLSYALAREEMFALATGAAAEITKPQIKVYAICHLAKRAHATGDEITRDTSMRLAREVAIVANVGQTNSHLVRAYFELGQADEALSFAKQIPNQTQRLFALTNVAEELAKQGRVDEAMRVIRAGQPPTWIDSGRVAIARASASAGNYDDAIRLVTQIASPENRDNVNAYLADQMIRAGEMTAASERIAEISDANLRASRRAQLATASTESQSVDALLVVMNNSESREEKLSLGQKLLARTIEKRDVEGAERLIQSLTKIIEDSPQAAEISKFGSFDDTLRIATVKASYMETASILKERGKNELAAEHVQRAVQAAKDIESQGLGKSLLCQRLVQQLVGIGELEGAKELIETLDTDFIRATASADLAASLILAGQIDEGMALAQKSVANRSMGHGSARIAIALFKRNEKARLIEYLQQLPDSPSEVGSFRDVAYRIVEQGESEFLESLLPKLSSDAARVHTCLGAYEVLTKSN